MIRDFNLAVIKWDNQGVIPITSHPSDAHQPLAVARNAFLDQVVTEPTRRTEDTQNILDLFFTSNKSQIHRAQDAPEIGDYDAVLIESSVRTHDNPKRPEKVNLYKKAYLEGLKGNPRHFREPFLEEANKSKIENLCIKFKRVIWGMGNFIPSKLVKGNKIGKPWFDKKVISLMTICKEERVKYSKHERAYKKVKASVQRKERRAYW